MRVTNYSEAVREGHAQMLASDPSVFVIGQGLWSPWYAGASLKDLDKEFGRERIIDSPVSENATTGAAIGAAIAGMRPIVFHPRMDFMLLAVDPIVNQAANWSYVFGGKMSVPLVIRAVINRRGEQGAQHSQALQAMFAHIPGLKVVMPSTPYDAKGLLIAAVRDDNPVLYIDDRELYDNVGPVPEEAYEVEIGKAAIRREGRDVTVVATSRMAAIVAALDQDFAELGIDPEIIDLRSLKPWDRELVLASVSKTRKLVIVDEAWKTAGFAAEVAATVADEAFYSLAAPIARLCLPDIPAPASRKLEESYYLTCDDILATVQRTVHAPQQSVRKAG
jgi:pyruvate/2-oxoglutarate/acetoin dehydrogenase E1 component